MFDPSIEQPIPLAEAACLRWIPKRGGRPLHFATVWRWASKGIRGHKLATLRVGGTLCTSEAALKRFFSALSTSLPEATAPLPASPRNRMPDRLRAERELDRVGIK